MPQLPPEWAAHLESGVSHRLGSCHADGRPDICRALAARSLPDGRIEMVLNRETSEQLLMAVADSRRVAYVASQPDTNRTLHLKGADVHTLEPLPEHAQLIERCGERFARRVAPFGFSRETIFGFWFNVGLSQLVAIRYTLSGAWDQSPGPGAGQVIELLP